MNQRHIEIGRVLLSSICRMMERSSVNRFEEGQQSPPPGNGGNFISGIFIKTDAKVQKQMI
jgi:hypothetical protein